MPQPIDPNTEIMRMSVAERIQQIMDRTSLAGQAHHASHAADEQVGMETLVQQLDQKDPVVDDEARRRNPYRGKRQKKKDAASSDAAHVFYTASERRELADDPDAHTLDVEV